MTLDLALDDVAGQVGTNVFRDAVLGPVQQNEQIELRLDSRDVNVGLIEQTEGDIAFNVLFVYSLSSLEARWKQVGGDQGGHGGLAVVLIHVHHLAPRLLHWACFGHVLFGLFEVVGLFAFLCLQRLQTLHHVLHLDSSGRCARRL